MSVGTTVLFREIFFKIAETHLRFLDDTSTGFTGAFSSSCGKVVVNGTTRGTKSDCQLTVVPLDFTLVFT